RERGDARDDEEGDDEGEDADPDEHERRDGFLDEVGHREASLRRAYAKRAERPSVEGRMGASFVAPGLVERVAGRRGSADHGLEHRLAVLDDDLVVDAAAGVLLAELL